MLKRMLSVLWVVLLMVSMVACETEQKKPTVKIGVSMGVGGAARWALEMAAMQERAEELGLAFEGRLNYSGDAQKQLDDCRELIDSGISVLIITPRDVNKTEAILNYAKKHDVRVVSYARAVMGESVDLFVGFDSFKLGQAAGQHMLENIHKGDLIILKGDVNDFNTPLLYYGGMKALSPQVEAGNLRVIFEANVPGWSPDAAKSLVMEAVKANGNRVHGILAPNDRLAGAAVEALALLGVQDKVIVTGMDAELSAVKRLVSGSQDLTIFMDLRSLARTAVDEAHSLATRKSATVNSALDNKSPSKIDAYLINGKAVTRENIDEVLIKGGVYTRDEIYGSAG